MMIDSLFIVVGFALVAKGGDLFVDSSIRIGKALAIPRIVIGGTLVSLATTAPELVVSVTAALRGDPGMALGNAIGSCICNIGLIVGAVALIVPVDADRADFIRRALWMAAGGLLVVGFSWDLSMERVFGWILLAGAFGYLGWDLFGTAARGIDISVVSARMVWYLSTIAIVAGHVAAVYLGHVSALRLFADRRAARRSQIPHLCLMVAYSMLSLWILSQPVVETS